MDQYIRYHKQPYAKYLDVKAFNEKFGTNIADVEDYDAYFHFVFTEARRMQGPSEFLLVKFANHDEFEEMGLGDWLKKKAKAAGDAIAGTKAFKEAAKLAKKGKDYVKKKLEKKPEKKTDKKDKPKEDKSAAPDKIKKAQTVPVQPEVNDLDELLSEEDNVVEEEYDDEVPETKDVGIWDDITAGADAIRKWRGSKKKKKATTKKKGNEKLSVEVETPKVKNIVTEKKKIADMVLKASKDSDEYHQDMKHLIRFKSTKLPLEEQLMKGRPKYLKALRAYLKGDNTAEVKMSWRKNNKMVKVSDLNPKRDSLKALLRSSAGNIRVVECV
tara:strand:+ start:3075 stop:4058 length:984 start_codon:yes stop_codon:yes gene_type:complete